MVKRRKVSVTFSHKEALSNIANYCNIVYKSNKYNYAVIYMQESDFNDIVKILQQNKNIGDIYIEEDVYSF